MEVKKESDGKPEQDAGAPASQADGPAAPDPTTAMPHTIKERIELAFLEVWLRFV